MQNPQSIEHDHESMARKKRRGRDRCGGRTVEITGRSIDAKEQDDMEQVMVTAQATCLRTAMPSFGTSRLGIERRRWLSHAFPERAMT